MKTFFNTFFGKLSGLFLVLLTLLGVVQVFLTINTWQAHYDEADQKLNHRLAEDMAKEFKPFLKDSLDYEAVHHAIHYMMVMNPKVEIYILDEQGKILAFFAEPQKKVQVEKIDLEPIGHFNAKSAAFPILGEDPRNPGVKKPFSSAPLKIGSETDGFLYIIIGSEQYDAAISTSREAYVAETLIKGLVIALLFTGFIGVILFAFLTRRMRRMSEVVSSFKQGNYEVRIDAKREDEIDQLGHTFNSMADTIEENIDELKNTDRLRRELIANISHDLRSPLASIRGYLETILIKKDKLSEEKKQDFTQISLDSTYSLESLVNQLFELSKLDAKQVEPSYEPFLIKDLVYDVIGKYTPKAEKNGITLKVDIKDGLPQAFADIGMIERVLSNLVENAINYTPKGGIVNIFSDSENEKINVRVMDTGPGIKEEDIKYIFDRFYRVEKSRSEKTGGTGLGLAISKKLMEIHNSTLNVASRLNEGSTFSFSLSPWVAANRG